MKIQCLLVDDEPLALEVLESHVRKINDLEIIGKCTDALEAFQILKHRPVDLLFLDIQVPEISGIDFLKSLSHPPSVILTTAYREYALEGFELEVVDYLLKPISFERFLKALNHYYQLTDRDSIYVQDTTGAGIAPEAFIYIKADRKMHKIFLSEIVYLESQKDYVLLHLTGASVLTKMPLSQFEALLPENQFLRIHRSYIVALAKIQAFNATQIEIGERQLPVGRNYKVAVTRVLKWDLDRI